MSAREEQRGFDIVEARNAAATGAVAGALALGLLYAIGAILHAFGVPLW